MKEWSFLICCSDEFVAEVERMEKWYTVVKLLCGLLFNKFRLFNGMVSKKTSRSRFEMKRQDVLEFQRPIFDSDEGGSFFFVALRVCFCFVIVF
jgi:hypothetical protein